MNDLGPWLVSASRCKNPLFARFLQGALNPGMCKGDLQTGLLTVVFSTIMIRDYVLANPVARHCCLMHPSRNSLQAEQHNGQ